MTKGKAKSENFTAQVFTRVTPEMAEKLTEVARRHRVNASVFLRWMIEDAIDGDYDPIENLVKAEEADRERVRKS